MLAWDWWSGWIMRKASLFVGPPGHRDLTLWVWPALGYCIVCRFPTSLSRSCTATHQRGGRKWLFMDGSVGACTGTQWRGESVIWLQLPFMILSHSPATSNLHESYRMTHYLHHHQGPISVHSLVAGLLLECNLLWSDFKVLYEWERTSTAEREEVGCSARHFGQQAFLLMWERYMLSGANKNLLKLNFMLSKHISIRQTSSKTWHLFIKGLTTRP